MPFNHEVGQVTFAQLLAHRESGLTASDNQRLDFLGGRVTP
jgi:hypothetical protein